MNTITKIGIAGGLIALVVWGTKAAQKAISNFSVDVIGYGRPSLSGQYLTVPIHLQFGNPTSLPINLDQLLADIYIDKNGQYVLAAKINQPVKISAGQSIQTISPVVDLKNIFGGNLINTMQFISLLIASKRFNVRTDVTGSYKGIPLPQQSFSNLVEL